jgi:hypothetical protein
MKAVRLPALAASVCLVCLLGAAAQGCTDGTTPDCSDAQCLVVSVVEAGTDGGGGDASDDGGDDAGDVTVTPDAGEAAVDAGMEADAAHTVVEAGVSDGGGDSGDAH